MPSSRTAKPAAESDAGVFVTSTGLKVKVTRVDPMFIQAVVTANPVPRPPTYEVQTVTGRTEVHRMDAVSAKQLENGMSQWQAYLDERAAAQVAQNDRVMKAMFLVGAECEVPDNGWEKKWKFLGVPVPTDPDERRVFYLMAELPAADVTGLMSAIMRLAGVDEEIVAEAEAAFRNQVPDGAE